MLDYMAECLYAVLFQIILVIFMYYHDYWLLLCKHFVYWLVLLVSKVYHWNILSLSVDGHSSQQYLIKSGKQESNFCPCSNTSAVWQNETRMLLHHYLGTTITGHTNLSFGLIRSQENTKNHHLPPKKYYIVRKN